LVFGLPFGVLGSCEARRSSGACRCLAGSLLARLSSSFAAGLSPFNRRGQVVDLVALLGELSLNGRG
jgi:hypothetical protein